MSRHRLTAIAVAALVAAVLGLRVFAAFAPIRIKVVRAPLEWQSGPLKLPVLDGTPTENLEPPVAIIWRVEHGEPEPARLRLDLGGELICERVVRPGPARRLDCVVAPALWASVANRELTVSGQPRRWRLHDLEVATHHGSSSAPFLAFVVPSARVVSSPSIFWHVLATAAVLALLLSPAPPLRRRVQVFHRITGGLALLLLAVVLVTPWITPFKVILASSAWGLLAALLLWPRLVKAARRALLAAPALGKPVVAHVIAVAIVAVAAARVARTEVAEYYGGNVSGLVHIAQARFDAHPVLRERGDIRASLVLNRDGGYDAQFVYFALFDPLLRSMPAAEDYRAFIDAPPYRFGRSGFVWLTKLVSLNRWEWYPSTMVWLVIAGMAGTAAAIGGVARASGASAWWALVVLAMPGPWRSLHFALPEPVAAALAATAVLCMMKARWRAAAVLFAAAILVRETVALLLVVVAAFEWHRGERQRALMLLAALAPFALWRLYVGVMLFPDWGAQAFVFNPGAYDWPGKAIAEVFDSLSRGAYFPDSPVSRAARWFPWLLAAGTGAAIAAARRRVDALTASAVLYCLLAFCLDRGLMWEHVANVERTTYEMFLLVAIAWGMTPDRTRAENLMLGTLALFGTAYVFCLGFDAELMRRALFLR